MIVPTGTGSFTDTMITVTEAFHTLNVGHQEDVQPDACHFGDNGKLCSECAGRQRSVGFEASRVAVSFVRQAPQGCPTQLYAETCRNEKCATPWQSQVCLWFFGEREDDAFDDERS